MNLTQRCSRCGEEKDLLCFELRRDTGKRRGVCLDCRHRSQAKWYDTVGRTPHGRVKRTTLAIRTLRECAESRGGICLSVEIELATTKYAWKCADGHVWQASWSKINKGSWCPYCAGNSPRNLEDLRQAAIDKGGQCLSLVYVRSNTRYRWKCASGHEWDATWNQIQQGHWCLVCSGRAPLSIDLLRRYAQSRNGTCLSVIYVNSGSMYRWRCSKGHEWEASADNVLGRRHTWCPHCSHRISVPQRNIYDAVRRSYPDAELNARSVLSRRRLELDIWVPSLRKAVEYDGSYWHSQPGAKDREEEKNALCELEGVGLLRVSDREFTEAPQETIEKVLRFLQTSKTLTAS